jgi:hypothetical protein
MPRGTVIVYSALLFALAGSTAFGADHYLITSKSQIKPSVRRALRGARGATGSTGPAGATGAAGSLPRVLPSGSTETGTFFAEGTAATVADLAAASISFAIPLASAPSPTIVTSGTTSSCAGSVTAPTAAPGALCIYVGAQTNVGEIASYNPFGGVGGTASAFGAGVIVDSDGPGNFYSDGTWAVTAP